VVQLTHRFNIPRSLPHAITVLDLQMVCAKLVSFLLQVLFFNPMVALKRKAVLKTAMQYGKRNIVATCWTLNWKISFRPVANAVRYSAVVVLQHNRAWKNLSSELPPLTGP